MAPGLEAGSTQAGTIEGAFKQAVGYFAWILVDGLNTYSLALGLLCCSTLLWGKEKLLCVLGVAMSGRLWTFRGLERTLAHLHGQHAADNGVA